MADSVVVVAESVVTFVVAVVGMVPLETEIAVLASAGPGNGKRIQMDQVAVAVERVL